MPSSRATISASWGESPDITAAVDTAVQMRNTTTSYLFYWITDDDTAPAVPEGQGHIVRPHWSSESEVGFTLRAGERLWRAIPDGSADITQFVGAA